MRNIIAIRKLYPEAVFETADGVFTEDWTPVTVDEDAVAAKAIEIEQEYTASQYQRKRALEYPAIGDQLDALFHAGVFPADMAAQIQAVKDKYPKG